MGNPKSKLIIANYKPMSREREAEIKNCQNCKKDFTIEPDDFAFYEKIKVPAPTFCPECRMQRRLVWRNERTLYRRKCDATGKDIVSIFAPDKNVKVYEQKYWWADKWNPLDYGQDYDFKKSFFDQFKELVAKVPLLNVFNANAVNSDYCNFTINHKNSYLVAAGWDNEQVMYSSRVSFSKDSVDCFVCHKLELGYGNISCKNSYHLTHSVYSENCSNSAFLFDCNNCQFCFGCTNLRSRSYCIFNEQYSKEDYVEKMKEFSLGSFSNEEKFKTKFQELKKEDVHRYAHLIKCQNVIGDNIEQSKNCYYCFDLAGEAENSKWSHWGTYGLKDSYDTGPGTGGKSELACEMVSSGVNCHNQVCTITNWNCTNRQYSFNCHSSNNIFGCVSLKNNQYCIFNKQYSKEEYEALVEKIKKQMLEVSYKDSNGRVYTSGEFFPIETSPFYYNDTVAQDYFPLTKGKAEEQGYEWKKPESKDYKITISAKDLPDDIKDVDDSIFKEVIGCAHEGKCNHQCTTAFKIIPDELQFYKKMDIALPRLCPNCRYNEKLQQRNPLKLWHRQCMCDKNHPHHTGKCPNEFETSYAPERPEIVYCESCYQREVA